MRSLLLFLFLFSYLFATEYSPYLKYSEEELETIAKLESSYIITKESLKKWDHILQSYVEKQPFAPGRMTRISTYLYAAQRDFAFLSKRLHGSLKGSIDFISFQILRLFYPLFPFPEGLKIDEYSVALGELVVGKYRVRMETEEKTEGEINAYFSVQHWIYSHSLYGKKIVGWLPWILPDLILKASPPPPESKKSSLWKIEVEQTRVAHLNATNEQKEMAKRWGNYLTLGNHWIEIGNEILFSEPIPLEKIISIRSILSMAIYDTLIAAFEGKYTYGIKPPYIVDRSITPYGDYFYYPSYPSVHTMVSYVSAYVLGTFFPDQAQKFDALADQIGQSRLWAGVNYPIDIQMGQQIAKTLYQNFVKKKQK